ncbi:hypothetical protein ACE1ET_20635, partial [Saccharicrinis sp. FJH62]|uniref:hypothetical protein n=1 Tax=Saccharicrinis sp. FJH62 TaxID=3344657 RepID=UPI0035D43480
TLCATILEGELHNMNKYILIVFFFIQLTTFGQSTSVEKYIYYENVINDLKSAKDLRNLESRYNYVFVLLLDSSNIELIEETGYQYLDEFRLYAMGLNLSNQTVGFVTDKNNITEIFEDENSLEKVLICTNLDSSDIKMTTFNFPIYLKDNLAIFETSGPTWSNTYIARLENGRLQINWLGGFFS